MTKTTMAGERVGVFAVDPGRTTGCAMAEITLKGSTQEIFNRDKLEVFEVDCNDQRVHPILTEVSGAKQIAAEYLDASSDWTLNGIPTSHQFLVFEDFILNRQKPSYKREGLSPVRVMSLVQGMLVKYPINYVPQQPGEAKGRWTNDRLRRSDLWTPRLEHGRDATRHAALWVVKQMA